MHAERYLVAALLLLGCGRAETPKTPVARIGNRTLTVEEIQASLHTAGEPSQAQMQQYVQRWIADEVLFREAAGRGMDQSEDIAARVEELRRTLAINALLDKEVYTAAPPEYSPEEIRTYYDAHAAEFVLTQDAALMSFALFKSRDAATAFRNRVLQGSTWHAAMVESGPAVVGRADSVYHSQQSLRPAELWRVAANAPGTDPSFPVNTSDGYYVLVVWKHQRQGQPADLAAVDQDIRHQLTVEFRRRRYDALVESLRSRQSIEVFLSVAPRDTASAATPPPTAAE